jgi:hypothetical protein
LALAWASVSIGAKPAGAQVAAPSIALFDGLAVTLHGEVNRVQYPAGATLHSSTETLYALSFTFLFGG